MHQEYILTSAPYFLDLVKFSKSLLSVFPTQIWSKIHQANTKMHDSCFSLCICSFGPKSFPEEDSIHEICEANMISTKDSTW